MMGDGALARFVGRRVQQCRLAMGMDREALAVRARTPVARLALQEEGALRLRAEELLAVADALGVPLHHLFVEDAAPRPPERPRDLLELESAYKRITNPKLRQIAVDGVVALADVN
jgi:transcriptional regulator with XRE-family HTH domain